MKKQIVHVSVHQTSKVIAATHTMILTVLFILPMVLGYWFDHQIMLGIFMLILAPLLIWLFIYLGYVVACWFYNLVIPWMGGIEVEIVDVSAALLHPTEKVSTQDEEKAT